MTCAIVAVDPAKLDPKPKKIEQILDRNERCNSRLNGLNTQPESRLDHQTSLTSGSDSGHELGEASSNEDQCDHDDDQDFEDASDLDATNGCPQIDDRYTNQIQELDLRSQLNETRHVLGLALNNQFNLALEICGARANEELYSSLAYATLCFLRASLTMDPGDMDAAVTGINKTFEVASNARRKCNMFSRFLYKIDYDQYSDLEIHAELVEAESLLLLSLISFLSDQSVICLVRSALRIRTCYQRYKECLHIMMTRTSWSTQEAKCHFESGVSMGYGTFNLLMSYLPRRVLRILEYVGFSGKRSIGINELDKSIQLDDGLRSTLAALITLTYHSYIENLFGLGNYEPLKVEQVSELLLRQHPNSAFFLLFRGRYHQMMGHLEKALETFQQSIEAQDDWIQFHSICHWEMMWCHAARMDWKLAAHYADLLRKRSKWSPASYTYQYATFLYMQLVEKQRLHQISKDEASYQLEQIIDLMKTVPSLRVRIAGKTVPAEKFAIVRSAKFLQCNNRLTLPALEFLYIWNIFVYLRNCPKELEKLLDRVELELALIKQESKIHGNVMESGDNLTDQVVGKLDNQTSNDNDEDSGDLVRARRPDDYFVCILLKGMCLKQLARYCEADEVLTELLNSNDLIEEDTFIVPHGAMDLALVKLEKGDYIDAKRLIKLIRNEHKNYLHEAMVHFKIHAANRLISSRDKEKEAEGY